MGSARKGRGDLAELRLYRLALAQAWQVSPDLRAQAVARMGDILADPRAGARAHAAAMRCLISATGATVSAIQAAVSVHAATELADRLSEIEARLPPGPPAKGVIR